MKYDISVLVARIRQCFAAALAVIVAFFSNLAGGEPVVELPESNVLSAYDSAKADYALSVDADNEVHGISDMLYGIFMEDINFAADGGLYAEKVANRSFEYTSLAAGDELYAWSTLGDAQAEVTVGDIEGGLNENNTNYLVINNTSDKPAGVANRGFLEGMSIEKDASYRFSVYAKGLSGYSGAVTVQLTVDGVQAAVGVIESVSDVWQKYTLTLTSAMSADKGVSLSVLIDNGSAALDMVSLFPTDTYKGRENGMRKDLAEKLESLSPAFLRFPGGCVIEGYDAQTAYSWKNSIGVGADGEPLEFFGVYGDVAARKQGINLWTDLSATEDALPCFMSYGLGFYEYFQLSEDIGAIGVPVLNCGLYCQMRGRGPVDMDSAEFAQYLQDMLDLVEFCRGSKDSKWGKVRASLGHEEVFELKYICIGNENEGEDYFLRYNEFVRVFNEAKAANPALYDGIELIYSSGASDATHSGNYISSYENAKQWLEENPGSDITDFAGATDQHYYNTPEWFLKNTDYYDEVNYPRAVENITDTNYGGAIQVFLGEYAAKSNTLGAALAEAAYMTGLERNGDIVRMAAYAPLFGNPTATHWSPDLIWFNNAHSTASVNYYVQKLFSNNAGSTLLSSSLSGALVEQPDLGGRIGVGTWYTAAEFDNVKIVDNNTGKVLSQEDFTVNTLCWNWNKQTDGDFKVRKGKLIQSSTDMTYSDTGSVMYYGSNDWTNYTYTVEATKTDGDEGFIIPFAVKDKQNNYFWNIGGWHNTVSCLQQIENGVKFGQLIGTVKDFTAETGKTYELKIVVSGTNVKCYIDGELYVDYETASRSEAEAYSVVSTDETGDVIVKLVNVTDAPKTFAFDFSDVQIAPQAELSQLYGESTADENRLGEAESCSIDSFTLDGVSNSFNYSVPQYSVTVMRLKRV